MGVLVIAKENREYNIKVQLTQGTLIGREVLVRGNEIVFEVSIEGQTIDVKLVAEGDKISGESSTVDGVFPITGTRQVQ